MSNGLSCLFSSWLLRGIKDFFHFTYQRCRSIPATQILLLKGRGATHLVFRQRIEFRRTETVLLGEPHLVSSEQSSAEQERFVSREQKLCAIWIGLGIIELCNDSFYKKRMKFGIQLVNDNTLFVVEYVDDGVCK